jgi:thiamine pyrophosphate-dependent acetolactate synthase large subunit-like protein
MIVAEAVGRALVAHGVDHVFGVIGSGNFHLTNAMVAAGARWVAAAHEGGAASMADAYARTSGRVAALSVHQGPGVTNALTGVVEAAKSRTPLIVLAPEATSARSNFHVELPALAHAIGAAWLRVSAARATAIAGEACALAAAGHTVVLGLPLDVQAAEADRPAPGQLAPVAAAPEPADPAVRATQLALLGQLLGEARRPVFLAGRGARGARGELLALAERCGALLAVSAAARGLFAGEPWDLDVSGGFATPLAAELIAGADAIVAWGSTLNMWTTRHGKLISPGTRVAQVDRRATQLAAHRPVELAICGDVAEIAAAVAVAPAPGYRSAAVRARIAAEGRWRAVPYADDSRDGRIDPRTLSIALDDVLPAARTVAIDSGNFMGYPAMFLAVPDAAGFCFTQAYQSIGLGLASALGAAVARPDRLTVAALGDGGFLMAAAELVTAVRLAAPLVVVVYNDAAYGAEVHHFGPDGHPVDLVRFPDTDLAAIARGYGCEAITVRSRADLAPLATWLAGDRATPFVIDAKVTSDRASWWLEEAFRGH